MDADMVKSPAHYTGQLKDELGIEVIDIACALNLNGNRFSILRYVCRAGLKDPDKEIEDLRKIKEYAEFEIRRLQGAPVSHTRMGNITAQDNMDIILDALDGAPVTTEGRYECPPTK